MGKARTKVPENKRTPKHSKDSNRAKNKDGQRSTATVKLLKLRDQKAKRDKKGRIVSQDLQSKELPTTRIQPDRRWFGNTRVIGQKQLETFREEMATKMNDPYAVILKEKKLPLSLVEDPDTKKRKGGKMARASLTAVEPFSATFGAKKTRKKPKLGNVDSYEALVANASKSAEKYEEKGGVRGDSAAMTADAGMDGRTAMRDPVFEKGQSKRIWGELYKVIDSSDVLLQVLDARDPMGTRCKHLESHLKHNHRQKHLIFVLNKCDLVRYVRVFRSCLLVFARVRSRVCMLVCRGFGTPPDRPPRTRANFTRHPAMMINAIVRTIRWSSMKRKIVSGISLV